MIRGRCPGQGLNRNNPEDIISYEKCPNCDYEIEFFFDDKKRKCNDCETVVYKDLQKLINDYACVGWCPEAARCLGPEIYSQYIDAKASLEKKLEES